MQLVLQDSRTAETIPVQGGQARLKGVGPVLPDPGVILAPRDPDTQRIQDMVLRARPKAQAHPAGAVKGPAAEDQPVPVAAATGGDLAPHEDLGTGPASSGVFLSRRVTRRTAAPFKGTGAPEAMPWTHFSASRLETGGPPSRFRARPHG